MSYTGNGYSGSCYHCGRDRIEVYQKKGNVGCNSCNLKYLQDMEDEEKAQKPTLRDQFAMSALNATRALYSFLSYPDALEGVVKNAYDIADMMLKQREINNG